MHSTIHTKPPIPPLNLSLIPPKSPPLTETSNSKLGKPTEGLTTDKKEVLESAKKHRRNGKKLKAGKAETQSKAVSKKIIESAPEAATQPSKPKSKERKAEDAKVVRSARHVRRPQKTLENGHVHVRNGKPADPLGPILIRILCDLAARGKTNLLEGFGAIGTSPELRRSLVQYGGDTAPKWQAFFDCWDAQRALEAGKPCSLEKIAASAEKALGHVPRKLRDADHSNVQSQSNALTALAKQLETKLRRDWTSYLTYVSQAGKKNQAPLKGDIVHLASGSKMRKFFERASEFGLDCKPILKKLVPFGIAQGSVAEVRFWLDCRNLAKALQRHGSVDKTLQARFGDLANRAKLLGSCPAEVTRGLEIIATRPARKGSFYNAQVAATLDSAMEFAELELAPLWKALTEAELEVYKNAHGLK
jgi:hypothetical protein